MRISPDDRQLLRPAAGSDVPPPPLLPIFLRAVVMISRSSIEDPNQLTVEPCTFVLPEGGLSCHSGLNRQLNSGFRGQPVCVWCMLSRACKCLRMHCFVFYPTQLHVGVSKLTVSCDCALCSRWTTRNSPAELRRRREMARRRRSRRAATSSTSASTPPEVGFQSQELNNPRLHNLYQRAHAMNLPHQRQRHRRQDADLFLTLSFPPQAFVHAPCHIGFDYSRLLVKNFEVQVPTS